MKTAGVSGGMTSVGTRARGNADLLSALTGSQADRERTAAYRTRRVVMASLGVMQDRKAGQRRNRAVALAAIVLVVLVLGPFAWRVADDLIGGERLTDLTTQFSLWVCIFLPAVVAAVLVAGWARKNS
ncbi:MAG: hypothetical protein ACLGRW_13030 [Acidobacteriota bacterium]